MFSSLLVLFFSNLSISFTDMLKLIQNYFFLILKCYSLIACFHIFDVSNDPSLYIEKKKGIIFSQNMLKTF